MSHVSNSPEYRGKALATRAQIYEMHPARIIEDTPARIRVLWTMPDRIEARWDWRSGDWYELQEYGEVPAP